MNQGQHITAPAFRTVGSEPISAELSLDEMLDRAEAMRLRPRPVKDGEGGYDMLCPLHEDHAPSLNLAQGEEGRVLAHCFPCQAERKRGDTQERWFLRLLDRFRDENLTVTPTTRELRLRRRQDHVGDIQAEYIYCDANGKEVAKKVRRAVIDGETGESRRTFIWYRPLPYVVGSGHSWIARLDRPVTELPLYGIRELRAAIANGVTEVGITEGESDQIALTGKGLVAVCPPNGSGDWSPAWTTEFDGLSKVFIYADDDAKGLGHAEKVRAALSPVVKQVVVLRSPYCNDVRAHLEAGHALGELVAVKPDPNARPDLLAGLRTGDWLEAQRFDPLRYALDGVVPEGFVILAGPPKVGKSWLVLELALAVATGGTLLGVSAGPARPVLYLALEDGHRRLQDRCRKLLDGMSIPANLHFLTQIPKGGTILTVAEEWLDTHAGIDALVIADTLGRALPPADRGETTYDRDYRIGAKIKEITDNRPGVTLLTTHHDRKAGAEDFVDSVSGTHGLAGSADAVILLNRKRVESVGLLKVTGRDVREAEYAVNFDGSQWTLSGKTLIDAEDAARAKRARDGLAESTQAILDLAGERKEEGIRAADVEKVVGIDTKMATTYLGRLAEKGRLKRTARGLYTLPWLADDSPRDGPADPPEGGDVSADSVGCVVSVGNEGASRPIEPTKTTDTTQPTHSADRTPDLTPRPEGADEDESELWLAAQPPVCRKCRSTDVTRFGGPWWTVACPEHDPRGAREAA